MKTCESEARASGLPYGARTAMDPIGLRLEYLDVETDVTCTVESDSFGPIADESVDLVARLDGEVLEVEAKVLRPIVLKGVKVVLRHAFSSDELVLMNGYQSWTDTREMPAWERMRGLRGVLPSVVRRWALDGGGDYSFVRYTGKRGEQHGFTYATFRRGEGAVLVGSLDESHGFTLIHADANVGEVTVETEPPARELDEGERLVLGRYAICRGTLDTCYDRWFELSGVHARSAKPIVGYTSWYRHYGDITEEKLMGDLTDIDTAGTPVVKSLGKWADRLFQIDDGYCKVGDWLDVDKRDFPHGLAPLTERIRERGFMPGLWVAPYLCERDSRLFKERPDWLLRDEAGEPVPTGSQWSGGFALDTLNVDVRSYVLEVLQTMTREWGFSLLKVDFLFAACMRPHGGMNRGELMEDAMKLLRTGVGDDTLILGCGVPLGSAFGVVDYCRIGCDVGLDWDDVPYMRTLHRERVSTRLSLQNTRSRAPLDGRAFGNDPDVFFLRDDVNLTEAQREELLFANANLGSVLLTSDDKDQWTRAMRKHYNAALRVFCRRFAPDMLDELNETLPTHGVEDGR
ncbi:MAG: alpha-galactosidase [Eggerthellaceae bacterium]|nr:alpha-galactosidase [Eggerthellaceae bacterium]